MLYFFFIDFLFPKQKIYAHITNCVMWECIPVISFRKRWKSLGFVCLFYDIYIDRRIPLLWKNRTIVSWWNLFVMEFIAIYNPNQNLILESTKLWINWKLNEWFYSRLSTFILHLLFTYHTVNQPRLWPDRDFRFTHNTEHKIPVTYL